jgi:hypothetical protein
MVCLQRLAVGIARASRRCNSTSCLDKPSSHNWSFLDKRIEEALRQGQKGIHKNPLLYLTKITTFNNKKIFFLTYRFSLVSTQGECGYLLLLRSQTSKSRSTLATEGRKKRDAPATIERISAMGSVVYFLLRGVRSTVHRF